MTKRRNLSKLDFIETPFTILLDSREQIPYRFDGFKCDAKDNYLPLVVKTKKATLKTGDYTIEGMEADVTVERKSLSDAIGSFVRDRERFVCELERMQEMKFACVMIESTENTLYRYVEQETGGSVKSFYRTLRYWPVDYGVHFCFADGRNMAERNTLRILQRFWEKNHDVTLDQGS